jgi:hypothetical protein
MRIYIYIYIYICTCVHIQTCMHAALASTHACKHTQAGMRTLIALAQFLRTRFGMCIHIHVCVHACTCIQRYIRRRFPGWHTAMHAHMCTRTSIPRERERETHTHMQIGWASETICWGAHSRARRYIVRMRECVYDVFLWQPCRLLCTHHVDTELHTHACLQRSCMLTKAFLSSVHIMHVCTNTHAHTNKANVYLGLIPTPAYVYICMSFVHRYAHIHTRLAHALLRTHACIRVQPCIHPRLYAQWQFAHTCVHTRTHMHACIHKYIDVCLCVTCAHTYTCIYAYGYMYIHVHMSVHIYIYTHTYAYSIYIYIYMNIYAHT